MINNSNHILPFDTAYKTIHVLVALCDNKYQGIVPVPTKIGNGQNPETNLYWGNGYGVYTYFKHSKDWQFVSTQKSGGQVLERAIFKHRKQKFYLVADAYDGRYIKNCIISFLNSSTGKIKDTLKVTKHTLGIYGNANLLAYIGHNGLMDFELNDEYQSTDGRTRNCIVLACYSKKYFGYYARKAGINPLLWTTNLMCPEAYTLHDAITDYINKGNNDSVRNSAVTAYNRYQKCGINVAKGLLVSGW
ncbi:hypothetical protein GCM10027037_28130 [Mucilaginibacter koreensis]